MPVLVAQVSRMRRQLYQSFSSREGKPPKRRSMWLMAETGIDIRCSALRWIAIISGGNNASQKSPQLKFKV